KVHVHTDGPERAAGIAAEWGVVEGMKADDMRRQEAERAARLAAVVAPGGLVAVVAAAGVRDLLAGLGAAAVAPGELRREASVVLALDAPPDAGGAEVVVAPSLPAMLAAATAWDPEADPADAAGRMREAAGEVTAIDVPRADRESLAEAIAPAVAGAGLVTALVGEGAGVSPAEVEAWLRALVPDGVEVEAHFGGQAAPALAVGVE
ncbi:MAG TPA: hypothetical protein VL422_09645, partial [Miltoncostaea sp.]|nr:hypothetical protein [Miltoncostaea sp.]